VGKKYGKLVPALTAALRDLSDDEARRAAHAAEANQPFTLPVDGETIELQPEELLIETRSPEGYTVAEYEGTLVALNTTVTPELRLEGAARDLVRNVQDARKNAGLEISDRIVLYLDGGSHEPASGGVVDLQQVIAAWGDYIKVETLATDLRATTPPEDAHTEQIDLDERTVTLGIVRQTT
jgi:isoleucyl-tRNA synthetase